MMRDFEDVDDDCNGIQPRDYDDFDTWDMDNIDADDEDCEPDFFWK